MAYPGGIHWTGAFLEISVVIADDHHIVRQSLRALIEKAGDIEVVAEAADGRVMSYSFRTELSVLRSEEDMPSLARFGLLLLRRGLF